MRRLSYVLLGAMGALAVCTPNRLDALELSRYFSDNMVLQRDQDVRVWGTAAKDETVTVTFAGQTKSAKSDESGRWLVTLDPMPANAKGQKLSVHSSLATRLSSEASAKEEHLSRNNVVVGDVYLFARQSSIDVSLGTTPEGEQAASELAADKAYRFIQIKTSPSREPLDKLKEEATRGWQAVDKTSALAMSAAAFYLGRDLAEAVDAPIGIVDLNMGYHFAAAWMSEEGLEKAASREVIGANDVTWFMEQREGLYNAWDNWIAGYNPSKPHRSHKSDKPLLGMSPIEMPHFPAVCYNAVIHPMRGLVLKGMLLQLGNDYPFVAFTRLRDMGKSTDMAELGKANAQSYEINKQGNRMTPCVLPAVIDDIRFSLGDESLSVGWIMPPGSDVYQYGAHNREVRELQRRAQAGIKGVDLILPGAEHVRMSGQPADEALLASRCKQWVLGTFYGAEGPTTGPVFDRVEFGNDTATIHFKPGTAEGLTAEGDALKHFELAGGDREFVPCKAEIDGSTIKLTSDTGSDLMYVRFGWSGKPVQGLVNSAGLPAIPFNTNSEWEYDWWPELGEVDLPAEYTTPANKWPKRDYAIINYATESKSFHLGPTGLWGTPAGPNIYVRKITAGSPADGKVLEGDMIYGVDGKEFGPEPDDKYVQFAAGITKAESETGGGTMILNIRRDDKLIEVPIKLEYMGTFSATSPYDCEKSKRIIKRAEEYMRNGLRPKAGVPNDNTYMYGPWNDNVLFLMASGNPQLQGLVRRYIHQKMNELDAGTFPGDKGWGPSYISLLFGEYYHRTGDSSVLPYLAQLAEGFAEVTPKDWPPTEPSRYGIHPAAQMPSTMGMVLAREAGVKVDQEALYYAIRHLYDGRAENGFILYNGYSAFLPSHKAIDEPRHLDEVLKAKGMLGSMNGKLGTGAALFSLLDGREKAVTNCSEVCVYAFNKTRTGHGGAWFNNFWTPIGAYHAGEEKFQHFMKGQQWWRELYRDHTGAVWQEHNAKGKQSVLAVGFVTHRVAHHKRLRMFGAPRSAFGTNPPAYLKAALAAHGERDYALAETLIQKELAKGNIPENELAMVEHLLDSVKTLRASVEYDLAYTEDALKRGQYHLASIELPQLKMVVAPENDRLKAIAAALESKEGKAKIKASLKQARANPQPSEEPAETEDDEEADEDDTLADKPWPQVLASIDTLVKDDHKYLGRKIGRGIRDYYKSYSEEQLNRWRMRVLETPDHAPNGWQKPDFDVSGWDEVPLPIIWPMAHTALLRTTFEVKDVDAYSALHIRGNAYKQRSLAFYLNGEIMAKVNNIPRKGDIDFRLPPYALEVLKEGKNTLAVSAQHGKRSVYFSLRLEGRLKDE